MTTVKRAIFSILLATIISKVAAVLTFKHISSCHKCSKKAKRFHKDLKKLFNFRNKCFRGLMQRKARLFADMRS
jgi:hypothetical protein